MNDERRRFQCEECPKTFSWLKALVSHKKKTHQIGDVDPRKYVKCWRCNEAFTAHSDLCDHFLACHEEDIHGPTELVDITFQNFHSYEKWLLHLRHSYGTEMRIESSRHCPAKQQVIKILRCSRAAKGVRERPKVRFGRGVRRDISHCTCHLRVAHEDNLVKVFGQIFHCHKPEMVSNQSRITKTIQNNPSSPDNICATLEARKDEDEPQLQEVWKEMVNEYDVLSAQIRHHITSMDQSLHDESDLMQLSKLLENMELFNWNTSSSSTPVPLVDDAFTSLMKPVPQPQKSTRKRLNEDNYGVPNGPQPDSRQCIACLMTNPPTGEGNIDWKECSTFPHSIHALCQPSENMCFCGFPVA